MAIPSGHVTNQLGLRCRHLVDYLIRVVVAPSSGNCLCWWCHLAESNRTTVCYNENKVRVMVAENCMYSPPDKTCNLQLG